MLESYLHSITDLAQGDAREESHYSALKTLLEAIAQAQGRSVQVTVLPKPTEAASPDFCIWGRLASRHWLHRSQNPWSKTRPN